MDIDTSAATLDMNTGIVTLLFTDIEGSTEKWEQEPERMADALARHDVLLRAAVEAHHGRVIKTTGDGIYAAFADAANGVERRHRDPTVRRRSSGDGGNVAPRSLRPACRPGPRARQ